MTGKITAQDFVTIWQGSATLAEVCERTGYSASYASQRASRLRRKTAPGLKRFATGPTTALEVPDPEVARATLALEDHDAAEASGDDDNPHGADDDGADWD